jgi:uncharacterized glyoxalase superfamily protein PhnB
LKKMTTILLVEEIELGLDFWTQTLGFSVTFKMDHNEKLGFVILSQGNWEVMLQTRDSMGSDVPALAQFRFPPACVLYFDVEKLDDLLPKLAGLEVVVPKRKTFYGAWEVFVREPCGHVLGFAEPVAE